MRRNILRLAVRLLAANRPRLIVLLAGALAVALAASSISLASVVSLATVHQTVAAGWRGSYDILVRPRDALTLHVDGREVVPANYLGARTSGISRDQWQQILAIPGVEVAAPVAALGWLKQDTSVVTFGLSQPEPGEILQLDLTVDIGGAEASRATGFVALEGSDGPPSLLVGVRDLSAGGGEIDASVGEMPAVWGLVVGIDPGQEDRLIGLSQFAPDAYLPTGVTPAEDVVYGSTAIRIPVLIPEHLPLPGTVTAHVSRIVGVDPKQVADAVEQRGANLDDEGISDLIAAMIRDGVTTEESTDAAPLADLLQPLRNRAVSVENGELRAQEGQGAAAAFGRNVILVPEPLPYRVVGSHLGVAAQGSWEQLVQPQIDELQPDSFARSDATFGGDAEVFRPLHAVKPPLFQVESVGTYDLGAISATYSNAANYVPLGIYGDTPRTTAGDRASLLPTSLNPGGLNPLPPTGLTNLEAVEALRGPEFIDAIRVKLEGISGYSPGAISRIEEVAAAIVERTGLHVDVVAGSSPVDLEVEVDDGTDLIERWTTLGEAVRIENGASGFSGLLLGAAALVVLLYLATFCIYLVGDQGRELAVLRLVGWRGSTAVQLIVVQAVLLGALAAVLATTTTMAIGAAMGLRLDPLTLGLSAAGVIVVHLAAAGIVAALLMARKVPAEAIRGQSSEGWYFGRGMISFAIAQAADSKLRFLGTTGALALATAIAGVVVGLQVLYQGRLSATVFGQLVALRIGPYHLLGAAAALFAAGAMAVDAGVLGVERRLSLIGLLRALGWHARQVRRLILAEVGLPGVLGGVIAGALITSVLLLAGGSTPLSFFIGLLAAVGASLLGIIAATPAADLATRVVPAAILQVDGASSGAPGFSGRSAMLTLGTFATVALVGALLWSVISPMGIPQGAFAQVPTAEPLPPAAAAIQADVAALTAQPDRRAGTPAMDAAQAYVQGELEEIGYQVEHVAFLSNIPALLQETGEPLDQDRVLTSFVAASVAYSPAVLEGATRFDATSITYLDGMQPLGQGCPEGLVVLRVGAALNDYARSSLPAQLLTRCAGTTDIVVGITAPEPDWAEAPRLIAAVEFAVGDNLIARRAGEDAAPWLVARLDSSGPGATQSAAGCALALEVARLAANQNVPLRLAFVDEGGGGFPATLREITAEGDGAPLLLFGTLSGSAAALGTARTPPVDPHGLVSALLASVSADETLTAWVADAQRASLRPTSSEWLARLSAARLTPGDAAGVNILALAAGLDAAIVMDEGRSEVEPVAGTSADTPAQIDHGSLGNLAQQLSRAVGAEGVGSAG